jgi:TonB family protein
MRSRVALLALMFVFAQNRALPAKDPKWFEVSSDHFLLYTDTNETKGRRLLSDFEMRVAGFSQTFGTATARAVPIEIFLFNEEADFIEALPRVKPAQNPQSQQNPLAQTPRTENQMTKSAYLLRGPDRIFIVAKDKSPEDIADDVAHALGHVLFERNGIWRPFWLAEGTAEYVRKLGRSADTKAIPEEDGFSAEDMLTIVPSATYDDNDPPTAFRAESYRLVRLLLDQKPDALRRFVEQLRVPSDAPPKISVGAEEIEAPLKGYVETPLKLPAGAPSMKSSEADPGKLAIHRGDLMLATDRPSDAGRWYNADSSAARAARAILTRFSRPPAEAVRVLERTARELPDNGLVQYHFGAMEVLDKKDVPGQVAALERATKTLPLMGRAFAELARVYALNGQADKALALVDKAVELEPEYADRFYEIRADVHLALDQSPEALRAINIASDLPHVDRSAVERYTVKVYTIRRRIEAARREVDQRELDSIEKEVRAKSAELEPPPLPSPPPPPVPEGNISYEIETRAPIEVVDAVYPDYPEALRRKGSAGTIAVQVDIGPDGKVKTATIGASQVQDLNKAVLDAVKKWSFTPGNRSIRLVMKFSLQ